MSRDPIVVRPIWEIVRRFPEHEDWDWARTGGGLGDLVVSDYRLDDHAGWDHAYEVLWYAFFVLLLLGFVLMGGTAVWGMAFGRGVAYASIGALGMTSFAGSVMTTAVLVSVRHAPGPRPFREVRRSWLLQCSVVPVSLLIGALCFVWFL